MYLAKWLLQSCLTILYDLVLYATEATKLLLNKLSSSYL